MKNQKLAEKIVHHMTGDLQQARDVVAELADTDLIAPDTNYPAILYTRADFASAPVGTIVAHPTGAAAKVNDNKWAITGKDEFCENKVMEWVAQVFNFVVLHWGSEEAEE